MSLSEVQRAFLSICFDPVPARADLDMLSGERQRWLVYRDMVRARLRDMAAVGLPRTRKTLGEARFDRAFTRYLAEDPPRSRYIRDVVPHFVCHATRAWEGDAELPAHLPDLARYEAAKWVVADEEEPTAAATEFDFDKPAVFTPAHRLLRLRHAVHRAEDDPRFAEPVPIQLLVYRRKDGKRAHTWSCNAVTADLIERWAAGEQTVSEAIRTVAEQRGLVVDQRFLDGLCTVLADFIERGIVLGSR